MSRPVSALLALSLALTSLPAVAGGYDNGTVRHRKSVSGHGLSFGWTAGDVGSGYRGWSRPSGWDRRDSWNGGWSYGSRSGWGRSRGYDYDRYRHRGNGDEVVLGVVLGAVALGAIAAASKDRRDRREDVGGWIDPDGPAERVVVAQSAPTAIAEPAFDPALGRAAASGAASCLQTREYTTKITIGGKQVDAYGTACLQPDGTWFKGPWREVPSD